MSSRTANDATLVRRASRVKAEATGTYTTTAMLLQLELRAHGALADRLSTPALDPRRS